MDLLRRHWLGAIAVAGLLVLAGVTATRWVTRSHAPDYTGQTRAITLTFQCTNAISWKDPASTYDWWAGESAAPPSNLDTSRGPGVPAGLPEQHAEGRLHFDTASRATFTSDAGGQLRLRREPKATLHDTDCAFQG
jgi:hypothetical protein